MTLGEYFKTPNAKPRTMIARNSGVSLVTVSAAAKGMKLELYRVAKAISDATDGVVSIKELCE